MNRCGLFGLIVLISSPLFVSAAEYGYTHDYLTLNRVAIPSGRVEIIGEPLYLDIRSLALSPDGQLYGLLEASQGAPELCLLDTDTGQPTIIGSLEVGDLQDPTALTFHPDGRLLLLANGYPQSILYEVDPTTAGLTQILAINSYDVVSIAFFGDSCYAASAYRLNEVDLLTGDVTELPEGFGGFYSWMGPICFDGSGQLWAIEQRGHQFGCEISNLVSFDLATGEVIRVVEIPQPNGLCHGPLAIFQGPPVPVPAQGPIGYTLLILAVATLGALILAVHR